MKKLLADRIGAIKITAASEAVSGTRMEGADIRLQKDLSEISDGVTAKVTIPTDQAPRTVTVTVKPTEGVYAGGSFPFTLTIDSQYPIGPPKCLYIGGKIFHPNIDDQGGVCLNILKADWKPVLTVSHLCFGLELLFIEPNPDDPLPGTSRTAAELMRKDPRAFAAMAQEAMLEGGCYIVDPNKRSASGRGEASAAKRRK